jgi:nucleoside 2-deoxyribosyltransferase
MWKLEPKRPLIYLAAPLFSEAELSYNQLLAGILERHVDIYLPQRDGGKLVDLVAKGVSKAAAYKSIFERDVQALKEADVLFLVMDGRSIDEGAAFELGYAAALNKLCVGLQTDPRRLLPMGNNPMIQVPLKRVFHCTDEVAQWAKNLHLTRQKLSVP